MKYEAHIKTGDYSFLGFELEGTVEEAVQAYRDLERAYNGGAGVGIKKLAEIIHEYCKTGNIADGGGYDFSSNESLLLNELKKLVRKSK